MLEGREGMFYLMVHSTLLFIGIWCWKEGRVGMFYLMVHSTHFIYRCMTLDIW